LIHFILDIQRKKKECKDVPKFELIKRESKIKKKSAVEGLKQEIIDIQKEIEEIDQLNLPDNIDSFDPIELFQFKESYLTKLTPNFNPLISKKAGTMYAVGVYIKNIKQNEYNSKNFIIQNISEALSIPIFKRKPNEMIGSQLSLFSPNYSQKNLSTYGKVKNPFSL
jgi:hypothetical protein